MIMSFVIIVGVFIEDGEVCTYYNVPNHGKDFTSGDVIELPRNGKQTAVVILGVHENLGPAVAAAQEYFKRLCKWDNVEDLSTVKLFGHDLSAVDEEMSQIAMFATQGIKGPLLSSTNSFDLMDNDSEQE